jgi:sn-glycerol 3-phosphate transport system permease protein
MVEHRGLSRVIRLFRLLTLGVAIVAFPVYLCFVASTHPQDIANGQMPLTPGPLFFETYYKTLFIGSSRHHARAGGDDAAQQLHHGFRDRARQNRDLDHLRLRGRLFQISVPHGGVLADLHHADAAGRGAHLPDLQDRGRPEPARQLRGPHDPADRIGHRDAVLPPVLHDDPRRTVEASKLDGAGPFRFFWDTVLPLSRTNIAALFVILFIYGWNQYLWPLLITTRDDMQTIVIGIKKMIVTADALTEWNVVLATAMLAMLPPVAVVI